MGAVILDGTSEGLEDSKLSLSYSNCWSQSQSINNPNKLFFFFVINTKLLILFCGIYAKVKKIPENMTCSEYVRTDTEKWLYKMYLILTQELHSRLIYTSGQVSML